VATEDVAIAKQALAARDAGDREAVYALCAPDVEFVTPMRTLRGLDEIREKLEWSDDGGAGPLDHLDREVEVGDFAELGGGRVRREVRIVLRWKETGELANARTLFDEWTIRDGMIAQWAWGSIEHATA
jgi:ketosteroid isomerase-like protein